MKSLAVLLEAAASLHPHLCPRQVLGVRMGMLAGKILKLDLPQTDRRLFTIVETDGCFTDGISVATNCWVGRRTLRVEDYGKVAATFVDMEKERAVRLVPCPSARHLAFEFAAEATDKWEAMLLGYQRMPDADLFSVQTVQLELSLSQLIRRPGCKAICQICGEEIMNERELIREGKIICRSCAGPSYYHLR